MRKVHSNMSKQRTSVWAIASLLRRPEQRLCGDFLLCVTFSCVLLSFHPRKHKTSRLETSKEGFFNLQQSNNIHVTLWKNSSCTAVKNESQGKARGWFSGALVALCKISCAFVGNGNMAGTWSRAWFVETKRPRNSRRQQPVLERWCYLYDSKTFVT